MNPTLTRLTRLVGNLSREPDGRLLSSFLAGNQAAFRELVDRHAPLVFGVCNRILRHQQDAEDAFQAVFIVLAHRAADVWPQDAVGSWLYGVASRVALKARTLRTRRWSREEAIEEVVQPCEPTSEPDTTEVVDRAVRKLPEVYRAAVVACDLEGLSRKDAARRLGWTEGTLSGRLARARKILAERLRKAGFACPVAGLATVLGTNPTVRAGLLDTVIDLASSTSGIPAPVAALTQGVMQGMFAFKLKAAIAAILVACTVGFGAWKVGAGDEPGIKQTTGKAVAPLAQPKPQSPDLAKLQADLKLLEAAARDTIQALEDEKKKLTSQLSQGKIVRRLSDGIVEINLGTNLPVKPGQTFAILPSDFPEKGLKSRMRMFRIANDQGEYKQVERFVDKGTIEVIEVLGAKQFRCRITAETEPVRDSIGPGDLVLQPEEGKKAGAKPPENAKQKVQQIEDKLAELRRLMAETQQELNPRTAKPPVKIDPALKQLEGRWKIKSIADGKSVQTADPKVDLVVEIAGNTLFMPYRESGGALKRNEYRIAADANKSPRTINLIQTGKPVGMGIYEFTAPGTTCAKCHSDPLDQLIPPLPNVLGLCSPGIKVATQLHLTIAMTGPRPTKFEGTDGVLEFRLTRIGVDRIPNDDLIEDPVRTALVRSRLLRAQKEVQEALAAEEHARAQLAAAKANEAHAQAKVEVAKRNLELTRAQLEAAEKAANPPKPQPVAEGKDDAWITIHIRPQLVGEKILKIRPEEYSTVLSGIANADKEITIKPDTVTMWLVRDKKVLPIDLTAIFLKGNNSTNYQLRSGDKLFIQFKAEK